MRHFIGQGGTVTLRQVGLLEAVVDHYMMRHGVEKNLEDQIATYARRNGVGSFYNTFGTSYSMGEVNFSLGDSTIKGGYSGTSQLVEGKLLLEGDMYFIFSDRYEDVRDHGKPDPGNQEIPGGIPFSIIDSWGGSFKGIVHPQNSRSIFRWTGKL